MDRTTLRDTLALSATDAGGLPTITSVHADGTVALDFGGGRIIPSAVVVSTYAPEEGAAVIALRLNETAWAVVGSVRTSSPATKTLIMTYPRPYDVLPASSAANPLQVAPSWTGSYRAADGWSRTQPFQGAPSMTQGPWQGVYGYPPDTFTALRGKQCTQLRVRLHRDAAVGGSGLVPQWLALHADTGQAQGGPLWVSDAVNVGALSAASLTGTFLLPTEWGQALIDGRARGIGHLRFTTDDYSACVPLTVDALSGRLTVDWA